MLRGFVKCAQEEVFLFLKRASKLYELQTQSSLDVPLLWLGGPLCQDVGALVLHILREVSSHPVDLLIS